MVKLILMLLTHFAGDALEHPQGPMGVPGLLFENYLK